MAAARFDIDGVRELQASGRLMQRAVEPTTEYAGEDPSGTVSVVVDGRGTVHDVTIDAGWVSAVGPSELGAALLRAFRAANATALAASLAAYGTAVEAGELQAEIDDLADDEPAPVRERTYAELVAANEAARRDLAEAERVLAEFQRRSSVTGRARLLRLDLQGGGIAGITVLDRRRATQVPAYQLAREALALFHDAAPPRL